MRKIEMCSQKDAAIFKSGKDSWVSEIWQGAEHPANPVILSEIVS